MPEKTYGILVHGAGWVSTQHIAAYKNNKASRIVAICDQNPDAMRWYTEHFSSIRQAEQDYRALLCNPAVEAVYVAVPHHLHRETYCAAIAAETS